MFLRSAQWPVMKDFVVPIVYMDFVWHSETYNIVIIRCTIVGKMCRHMYSIRLSIQTYISMDKSELWWGHMSVTMIPSLHNWWSFLKRKSESPVLLLEQSMYEASELFDWNRLYDFLIHFRGNVSKCKHVPGRVRSKWTIHLSICCLENDVVAEGVYGGLCLYTDTYIHNEEKHIVIP